MKYHLTIWTDDGIKRELDFLHNAETFLGDWLDGTDNPTMEIQDANGKEWFFNWNHVLGGTIQKVEEK